MTDPNTINGIIVLDKPSGVSSAAAVERVKRLLPRRTKIGHAGTLDPFATGVLVLLLGSATRRCEALMNEAKSYEATVKLGATTATDDPDSPEILTPRAEPPNAELLEAAIASFRGSILQRPPAYSALKVAGRRAYELARSGRAVTLEARPVTIHRLEMSRYDWPLLDLVIECGRGTYVRSIARDLGERLATGGYLTSLRRTRVGPYRLDDAVALEGLTTGAVMRSLQPPDP
jgi:tRNA pseudouridine55 synthase